MVVLMLPERARGLVLMAQTLVGRLLHRYIRTLRTASLQLDRRVSLEYLAIVAAESLFDMGYADR